MVIDTAEALTEQLIAALSGGRRHAVLFSDHLEHRIYNQPALAEAMRAVALVHRQVQVHILLRRSDRVLKGGDHLLIDLARRLPSRVRLLQADSVACDDDREWLAVDESRCLLREQPERFNAVYRDDDPAMARQLKAVFDRYWAQGQPAPELARLSL